ncbi:tyrosine-protein phosphatase [Glaciecola siphonariae]|uniref:protein-tyrosine-phosphatase n=1 Tax=Glaciecola siphonariae TaxID=521012 RepID=A0ABV9LXD6_9ALTE
MIDIHSHILPGVDDGAKTLGESFDMLNMAIDQGVTTQVLTPHIHIGRYNNTKLGLLKAFSEFQARVKDKGLSITLRLAAEVRIGAEIMPLISNKQIPWLGQLNGKQVFLLEFPRIDVPHGSDNLVRWCIAQNVLPLIVHPERNKTFLNKPEKLQWYIKKGCPIQITASSLSGKFGDDVKHMALDLMRKNQVFAVASDCHNLKGRQPDLGKVYTELKDEFDADYLTKVFVSNPQSLLKERIRVVA